MDQPLVCARRYPLQEHEEIKMIFVIVQDYSSRLRVLRGWLPALGLICASAALGARARPPQSADTRQDRIKAAVARVYDTAVLHRIDIVVAPDDVRTILSRTSERV